MKLSVVIPLYNEEKNIPVLYNRLVSVLDKLEHNYELVFVNDGSSDSTGELLKSLAHSNPSVRYIMFARNFGHQTAIWSGMDACTGDVIVIMDGDLQDPPELIPELLEKYHEGYAVVNAKRKKRRGENIFKKLTAKVFYRVLSKMTQIDIPLDTGDFRLINRKVLDTLKLMPESHKYLRGQIAWVGFKQTHIVFDRDERQTGKTNFSFGKMLNFALDGITAFSTVPIRIVTLMGGLVFLFSIATIIWALVAKYVSENVIPGWTSIMILVSFIGGIQLISIGIIGEYISRISSDVRRRPLYVVDETNIGETPTDD